MATTREQAIAAYKDVLDYLTDGVSQKRADMKKTPERYIKAMEELTTPLEFSYTTFDNPNKDGGMIFQGPINIQSLCAHHTFIYEGVAYVAYIPNKKIVGLSKLARCVKEAGKKFSSQEEIVSDIVTTLQKELKTKDVACTLDMSHSCMGRRGVKAPEARTITTKLGGSFKTNGATKAEYMGNVRSVK